MKYLLHIALAYLIVQSCRCDSSSSEESDESTEVNKGEMGGGATHPCDRICKVVTSPRRRVCGSDGVTYPSFCRLKAARCTNPGLVMVSKGACPVAITTLKTATLETTTMKTSTRDTRPGFLTAKTIQSTSRAPLTTTTPRNSLSTLLSTATTAKLPTTTVAPPTAGMAVDTTTMPTSQDMVTFSTGGPSAMGTTLSVDDDGDATTQPFAVECPETCPLIRDLVCATDGVTYQSPCVLQLVACVRNDPTLMVASLGPCPTSTVVPTEPPTISPRGDQG